MKGKRFSEEQFIRILQQKGRLLKVRVHDFLNHTGPFRRARIQCNSTAEMHNAVNTLPTRLQHSSRCLTVDFRGLPSDTLPVVVFGNPPPYCVAVLVAP